MKDNKESKNNFSTTLTKEKIDKYDMITSIKDGLHIILDNSDLSTKEKKEYSTIANEVFDTLATIKLLRREYTYEIIDNKRSILELDVLKSIIDRLESQSTQLSYELLTLLDHLL